MHTHTCTCSCGAHNFASKTACHKCNGPKVCCYYCSHLLSCGFLSTESLFICGCVFVLSSYFGSNGVCPCVLFHFMLVLLHLTSSWRFLTLHARHIGDSQCPTAATTAIRILLLDSIRSCRSRCSCCCCCQCHIACALCSCYCVICV
jgi:hypothetical protein